MTSIEPHGRPPRRLTASRIGVYAFLFTAALFFLLPLWIMVMTSLKTMDEVRLGNILAWPSAVTFEPWVKAWAEACTGLACNGISVGFCQFGPDPDPVDDPVDRRRRHQRLCLVVLARARVRT